VKIANIVFSLSLSLWKYSQIEKERAKSKMQDGVLKTLKRLYKKYPPKCEFM